MNLREEYINFFKKNNHAEIKSAPLIPKNDGSVLFNTAGMQPLVPYLLGREHPLGKRLVNFQKCIRTNDLDEIGDKTHHTFFEMLGNWSLGDYFKEGSIKYSFEFLTEVLNIPVDKLAVTVYIGDDNIPKDEISVNIWKSLGINEDRIVYLKEDNFWIAGDYGPCGGDTEIFYFRSEEKTPEKFDPNDLRWVEIWNNVFMEYNKNKDGTYTKLSKPNVDTGMGLERTVAVLEGKDDNYTSSLWIDAINKIEEISNKPYIGNEKSMRIIADHIKASVFILSEGLTPSNTNQGYILRRLIRRAIRHANILNIDPNLTWEEDLANIFIEEFSPYYEELNINKEFIITELKKEKEKFSKTLQKGLREFSKVKEKANEIISKEDAFKLYDTYGFPIELTQELALEDNLKVDTEGFYLKFKEHQEKSREGARDKFIGGLASSGDEEVKLHTATHLLNAALKKVVNENIHQMGSNITSERLRFDFNHDGKLEKDLLDKVEDLVNNWIKEDIKVEIINTSKEKALKMGAECMFIDRYPDNVMVYKIGDISMELCGGPHVKKTSELGLFKIIKEEASSSGVRRIRATLE